MKKEIKKPVKSFEPTAGWRLTMKDIPEKDRPYEKCEREGVGALTDAELLANPYPDRKPAGVGTFPGNPDSGAGAAAGNFRAFASDSSRTDGAERNRQGQGNRTFVCGRTVTADLAHLDAFRSACVYGTGGDRRFLYGGNASQRAGRDAPDDPQYEAEADSGYPAVSGNLQSLSGVSEGDIYRGAALSCSQHRFNT